MKEKYIAISSALLIVISTFLPILGTPFGGINFFSNKTTIFDGIIFILLAFFWLFLFFKQDIAKEKIVSIVTFIFYILDVLVNYVKVIQIRKIIFGELETTSIAGLSGVMANSIFLSWGWLLLLLGIIGTICISYKEKLLKLFKKK